MQLLYPGFLWGLLAVGIPILIHLLQLRRPQRVLFTNTGFIREVELTTMRRRRLQELLVLLTRILVVGLLVLGFCQPFLSAKQPAVSLHANGISVLVDNSPSMQAQGLGAAILLQEAITGARALGRSYGANGRFQLVNQRAHALSAVAYDAELGALQTPMGKKGWDATGQHLTGVTAQQPLYIFSDFQKSAAGADFLKNISADKEVVLVPQVARPTGNIYVDSVWLEDAFVRVRTNIGLHIRLKNGGAVAVIDCPVKVLLSGRQVATFRTAVGAGQTTTAVVQVQLLDNKLAQGRVVTQDAPITFDNSYYFTLRPAAAIQLLEIGVQPVARQAYENEPLFSYSFAKPQELNYSKLRQANLVLINEVAQVDAGLRAALAQVVQRGGSVVVVPVSQAAARDSYHQLFRALGIGGEQWVAGAVQAPVLQEVALPNRQSPFFKDVFGAQPRQVAMPQAAPVLSWGRNGTDILRLRDGDSYLTEFATGKGHVYVFAAPFDKAYSDFAAHALFVPVLYRLAMLSYHNDQQLAYRLTAPAVTLAVPALGPSNAASLRLVRDSAVFVPTQRVQGSEVRMDVPVGMTEPGFYEVRQQGKLVTTLAFNADRHESELAVYSAADLHALIGPNRPNVRVLEGGSQPAAIARYRAEEAGQPLWRYCVVLALACLLVEGILLRFRRPKLTAMRPIVTA